MDNWITRIVATICAAGSIALFWVFGVFIVVPWRAGRMGALNLAEIQVIGVSLLVGLAVNWGALHIYAIADREANPRVYATIRALLIIVSIAAVYVGVSWTQTKIA